MICDEQMWRAEKFDEERNGSGRDDSERLIGTAGDDVRKRPTRLELNIRAETIY